MKWRTVERFVAVAAATNRKGGVASKESLDAAVIRGDLAGQYTGSYTEEMQGAFTLEVSTAANSMSCFTSTIF